MEKSPLAVDAVWSVMFHWKLVQDEALGTETSEAHEPTYEVLPAGDGVAPEDDPLPGAAGVTMVC
jgi:hypothetical protein